MRKLVSILAGTAAIGCMVASNINSSGSNARLHELGRAGMSVGRTELAIEQLPDTSAPSDVEAAKSEHLKALDRYKETFVSADLRIGGAGLLGNVAMVFLVVAVGTAIWNCGSARFHA